ncbi:DUF4258 domain-containing protein [Candidatus Woesearchaeota archaeon]|nr:DUF4258 domain-containing protein [Candidatus Woesearchaeota archaeon]
MQIEYTKHALYQLDERKVDSVWVEETVKCPDELRIDGLKHYAIKKLNGKTLKVVCVKETYIKIIALFWIQ